MTDWLVTLLVTVKICFWLYQVWLLQAQDEFKGYDRNVERKIQEGRYETGITGREFSNK